MMMSLNSQMMMMNYFSVILMMKIQMLKMLKVIVTLKKAAATVLMKMKMISMMTMTTMRMMVMVMEEEDGSLNQGKDIITMVGLMMMMMQDSGLRVRHQLVWNKNSATFSLGRLDYDYKHEAIMYTWTKSHHNYRNGAFRTSVWDIDKPRKCDLHPTMKPIELIANCLLDGTKEGDVVLDSFGGSGSTLIAAEQLSRKAYLMEIDPHYCDVIIQRWENLTGKQARKLT